MVALRTAAQAQARSLLDKIALLLRAAHNEMNPPARVYSGIESNCAPMQRQAVSCCDPPR